ncbi:DUF5666 domain-containing protein [Rhodothermus marinus]|uniref:DUF5666 domain-containing protein n=1 Tax=Rhodothermus marinus TaxID=29549 RepID=UPI001FB2AC04|nr:DUF5666 domain-containing protein [Rhodothermus marinus]
MQRIATTLAVALLLGLLAGTARADDRPGVSLEGTIEAIGETDLTLHGVTFRITALTRIYNTMEQPIPFGQLTVGQRVEIEGYLARTASTTRTRSSWSMPKTGRTAWKPADASMP